MFNLLIDMSDVRLPSGDVKGKGFVIKRRYSEALSAALRAKNEALSPLKSFSPKYKRATKTFNKNKYISAYHGLRAIQMHFEDLLDIRPADRKYLQEIVETATFHKDHDAVVAEMALRHDLKLLPFKKLFYGRKCKT